MGKRFLHSPRRGVATLDAFLNTLLGVTTGLLVVEFVTRAESLSTVLYVCAVALLSLVLVRYLGWLA